MNSIKRASTFTFLPILGILISCGGRLLQVKIKKGDKAFFNVNLDCTHKDMESHGYEYGDIVNVKLTKDNDTKTYVLPYVTNYNEAGTYGPCLCDYESRGNPLSIATGFDTDGLIKANFFEGGKAEITMNKEDGFAKTRSLIKVPAKLTYQECGYDNLKYANCRDVIGVGNIGDKIRKGALYRGSSPISDSKNKDRYSVVDQYLYYHRITNDISLSLTEEDLLKIYNDPKQKIGPQAYDLYMRNHMLTVYLGSDFFRTRSSEAESEMGGDLTAKVFKTISNYELNDSVFIHCNEGKDRTGFIIMILEALAGVSLNDLVADYMLTFCNYYNITEINNKEKYDTMANLTCYRNLYSFMIDAKDGNDRYEKMSKINMLEFDSKAAVMRLIDNHKNEEDYLENCARKYLLGINVTNEEITNIVRFLTTSINK